VQQAPGKINFPLVSGDIKPNPASYAQSTQSMFLSTTTIKKNCSLISSDINQLCFQLQSYSIPTIHLILFFLMFILKTFSKK
jgi:hypothetical protein